LDSAFENRHSPADEDVDDVEIDEAAEVVVVVVTVADGEAFGSVGLFVVFVLLEGFVETRKEKNDKID
jgi:hypothetical protein